MNFNLINRNSLMSGLYTDRPSYNFTSSHVQEQHLNPSKSKVNIRQSLNKTTENYTVNSPIVNSVRNSCLLNTSLTTHTRRPETPEDKVFKSKENQDPIVQKYRDNLGRYNSVMPSPNFNEERRKSDSVHHRTISRQEYTLKYEEEQPQLKIGNTEQVKAQIAILAKRVSANQQEINRLKQRNNKDKKWENLENQLSEYRNKIVQYYKFNSNHFNQIESKITIYQQQLAQLREKCYRQIQNQKTYQSHSVEKQLHQLYQEFRKRESSVNQLLIKETTNIENNIKQWANHQINILNTRLEKAHESLSAMNRKMNKIQQVYGDNKKKQEYKRSHKKCSNSFSFENKQVLIIKEDGQPYREKAKPFSNYYDPSSKKQYYDQTIKKDYSSRRETLEQPKRELIIKQKTYYIDSEGYLLDENKYYLLNNQNQQILIPEHIINCLKDNHILNKK